MNRLLFIFGTFAGGKVRLFVPLELCHVVPLLSHFAPIKMSESRTEIASVGEFGLIGRLSKAFENTRPDTVKGIGDDAAVVDLGTEYG